MVDRIDKVLLKLEPKRRKMIIKIVERIVSGDLDGLDVKKLKGEYNAYRVRVGKIRIIFVDRKAQRIVIAIERRSDNTYS